MRSSNVDQISRILVAADAFKRGVGAFNLMVQKIYYACVQASYVDGM